MEFEKLVRERYSVRKFNEQPVSEADLGAILEAARLAPSAVNKQPFRLLALKTPESMAKLAECTKYTFGAPLAIIVCARADEAWVRPFDQDNAAVVDATIAATHIMLAAHDRGLGSTWVGHFDPAAVRAKFNIPAELTPVAVFPIGHPAPDAAPAPMHAKRRELAELVRYESF